MTFNPLQERGILFERPGRNWGEMNAGPYAKNEVHPYTRAYIILMNGIEAEGALFRPQSARPAEEYRLGTEGPHPIEELRTRETVTL